jgi:hypothetical protein
MGILEGARLALIYSSARAFVRYWGWIFSAGDGAHALCAAIQCPSL